MKKILTISLAAILILTAIPAISAETTAFNGTLVVSVPAPLDADGLTAVCKDISRDGNAAWIELEKDNDIQYSHILKQGDPIIYENDSDSLTYRINAIFHGTQTNMTMISPIVDPSGIDLSSSGIRANSILLSMGERHNLSNGTEIVHRMMGVNGDKVWVEVRENGMVVFSHIMTEDAQIVYKNSSDEWMAYRIDAIFRGIEHDLIELSPIDLLINQSIIDFNNVHGLQDNFILDLNEQKDIGGGITLRCTDIDLPDGSAWIELSKNGTVQYNHILKEGEYFINEDAEIGMLCCYGVHRVFTGEVKLMNTPIILEDGEMVNTGFTVAERKLVEFSQINPAHSDFDVSSVPDRSKYIMVGLGVPVELSGGAKLFCKQIDQDGEVVWVEIERNEYEKSGKVINRTHPSFTYRVGDTEYVYDLEAVFLGKQKSVIEISFVGSSPVLETSASDRAFSYAVPAFSAFAAIVVLGLLAVARTRRWG